MKSSLLIQVDVNDTPVGAVEKMAAHREGVLHRAFSIFIFDKDGKWLLQQRAGHKYHSPGLWTNTCCGHPLEGEQTLQAARTRLKYEMGMDCELKNIFNFTYRTRLENGLVEHEFDHVFIGFSDEVRGINPDEVSSWKTLSIQDLRKEIKAGEDRFTEWFKMIFERVNTYYNLNYNR